MIGFRVEIREEELQDRLGALSNKANLVMARAANRAITNAKKNVKKEVNEKYYINQRDVGKTIQIIKANRNEPTARLISKDVHPNLVKFHVKPEEKQVPRKGKKMKPYKASVKRGGRVKAITSRGKNKAFIATMNNGFTGLFIRKDASKGIVGNIKGIYGPSVPQIIGNKEIMNKVQAETEQMLLKRIDHEINLILKK